MKNPWWYRFGIWLTDPNNNLFLRFFVILFTFPIALTCIAILQITKAEQDASKIKAEEERTKSSEATNAVYTTEYAKLLDEASQSLITKNATYRDGIEKLVLEWKKEPQRITGFEQYPEGSPERKNIAAYMALVLQTHAINRGLLSKRYASNGVDFLHCPVTDHRHDGMEDHEAKDGRQCANNNKSTRFYKLMTEKGGHLQVKDDLDLRNLRIMIGRLYNEDKAEQAATENPAAFRTAYNEWLDYCGEMAKENVINNAKDLAYRKWRSDNQEEAESLGSDDQEIREREGNKVNTEVIQNAIQRTVDYYKNQRPLVRFDEGPNPSISRQRQIFGRLGCMDQSQKQEYRSSGYGRYMIDALILNAVDKHGLTITLEELQERRQNFDFEHNWKDNVSFIWGHLHDSAMLFGDFYPGNLEKMFSQLEEILSKYYYLQQKTSKSTDDELVDEGYGPDSASEEKISPAFSMQQQKTFKSNDNTGYNTDSDYESEPESTENSPAFSTQHDKNSTP